MIFANARFDFAAMVEHAAFRDFAVLALPVNDVCAAGLSVLVSNTVSELADESLPDVAGSFKPHIDFNVRLGLQSTPVVEDERNVFASDPSEATQGVLGDGGRFTAATLTQAGRIRRGGQRQCDLVATHESDGLAFDQTAFGVTELGNRGSLATTTKTKSRRVGAWTGDPPTVVADDEFSEFPGYVAMRAVVCESPLGWLSTSALARASGNAIVRLRHELTSLIGRGLRRARDGYSRCLAFALPELYQAGRV